MKHIKRNEHKRRRSHAKPKPVSAEDRALFWEMVSRKGGVHIRF